MTNIPPAPTFLLTLFLAGVVMGAEGGGHVFRSPDGEESIALIDAEIAEIILPGQSAPRRGRYETRLEGEIRRVEVDLGDGVKLYYRLSPGGLLSEQTGGLLRLEPP